METAKNILVIGSSNTDMVFLTDHFPAPGETIIGGEFLMNAGGKGANQAVAAARSGGRTAFIAKLGQDLFGKETYENLAKEGIDTQGIFLDDSLPSGAAQITVDKNGENCIVVAPGANKNLKPVDIDTQHALFEKAEIILMQLEIPLETVVYAAKKAFEMGKRVILNPAPATELPEELFSYLYAITPNETETTHLTGVHVNGQESAEKAAKFFLSKGIPTTIITLGASGAYFHNEDDCGIIPAPKVTAVDSTAAGDTFNGALAVALSQGKTWKQAVSFANKAAALSVTRIGAQASIPTLKEITEWSV